MVGNYNQYHSKTTNFRMSSLVNSKAGIDFAMLFTLWASLSASDFALRATTGQDDPTGRESRRTSDPALLPPGRDGPAGLR